MSAIIAAQGAIDADEEDSSFAIAAILALGALALFTFPLIGHALHMSDKAYGLWSGLAVDNTAEATAAGALYSDAAAKLAVLAKTTRNAMIGFVVLGYAIYWATKGQAREVTKKAHSSGRSSPSSCSDSCSSQSSLHPRSFSKDQLARSRTFRAGLSSSTFAEWVYAPICAT